MLGIDSSKDDWVLNIYRAIKEAAPDTPDVEEENVTVLKHSTPLWFLWKSKADIIAKECALNLNGILSMGISSHIVSHLGEGAIYF